MYHGMPHRRQDKILIFIKHPVREYPLFHESHKNNVDLLFFFHTLKQDTINPI